MSYNADLRGIVEDILHKARNVRCSVASFSHLGSIVEHSTLLATVPRVVSEHLLGLHPDLRRTLPPFGLGGTPLELMWPAIADHDPACQVVRDELVRICTAWAGRAHSGTRR